MKTLETNRVGKCGEEGVIFDPIEKRKQYYSWGLEEISNNQAEALALWQGLIQAIQRNIQQIIIVEIH